MVRNPIFCGFAFAVIVILCLAAWLPKYESASVSVRGVVLRVDANRCVVRGEDGVRYHPKMGRFLPVVGDEVVLSVDEADARIFRLITE